MVNYTGRERIAQERKAAQENQPKEEVRDMLAGIGGIVVLLGYGAAIAGLFTAGGWALQHALEAYGITKGGLLAPASLVGLVTLVIAFGTYVGTRRVLRSLPKQMAREIEKIARR